MRPNFTVLLVMSRARRPYSLEQLEACRVPVLPACNLKEAMDLLANRAIDVVLADNVLPDGCWYDVLECLRRNGSAAQVIVCAPAGDRGLCAEVLQRGAYDLLVEPYPTEELLHVLEAAAAKTYMRTLAGKAPAAGLRAAG